MKTCVTCKEQKPLAEYHRNPLTADGVQSNCRLCCNAYSRAYRLKNAERLIADQKDYRARNAEQIAAMKRAHHAANAEAIRAKVRAHRQARPELRIAWKESNRGKLAALQMKREARQLNAMPAWANVFFIEEAYDLAQRRSAVTGVSWQVDHVVPMLGRTVCGLHVEHNLQVITAVANNRKGNRFVQK